MIRGNKALQKALVDVDDGTADGNLRVDPKSGAVVSTIANSDGRRGDGTINMRDFRVFRDAYLQAIVEEGILSAGDVSLDGPADHVKKDLNLDGCVVGAGCANAPKENVFPRYDFNGDGTIAEWFVTAPFKADPDTPSGQNKTSDLQSPPGRLRDVDVLADQDLWKMDIGQVSVNPADEGVFGTANGVWQPSYYLLKNRDEDDRLDYLYSADFHFILGPDPSGTVAAIKIFVDSELPDGVSLGINVAEGCEEDPFFGQRTWRQCIEIPGPGVGGPGKQWAALRPPPNLPLQGGGACFPPARGDGGGANRRRYLHRAGNRHAHTPLRRRGPVNRTPGGHQPLPRGECRQQRYRPASPAPPTIHRYRNRRQTNLTLLDFVMSF